MVTTRVYQQIVWQQTKLNHQAQPGKYSKQIQFQTIQWILHVLYVQPYNFKSNDIGLSFQQFVFPFTFELPNINPNAFTEVLINLTVLTISGIFFMSQTRESGVFFSSHCHVILLIAEENNFFSSSSVCILYFRVSAHFTSFCEANDSHTQDLSLFSSSAAMTPLSGTQLSVSVGFKRLFLTLSRHCTVSE